MEALRNCLVKCCKDSKNENIFIAAESIAMWMTSLQDKHARIQGSKLLSWLASEWKSPSVINNTAIKIYKGNGDLKLAAKHLKTVLETKEIDPLLRSMALTTLADSYREARGVEANLPLAVSMYEEAAELGFAPAAYNAALYFDGQLGSHSRFKPDASKAARYYKIASDKGEVKATTNLGILHLFEAVDGFDKEYGRKLLRSAVAQGDQTAREALVMYELAANTPVDGEGDMGCDQS
jgi:hypothetical protein